jgi:hypothetical protein
MTILWPRHKKYRMRIRIRANDADPDPDPDLQHWYFVLRFKLVKYSQYWTYINWKFMNRLFQVVLLFKVFAS